MNKFILGATALALSVPATANDADWAQLDRDIQALSANVQGLEDGGIKFGGRIRAIYASASDIPVTANADLGGFSVRNARIYSSGQAGNSASYRVEVDFAEDDFTSPGSDIGLLDAYIDIEVGEKITARVGQFRGHVLRESLIDSGNLFFVDRSIPASVFSGRQAGLAVLGEFDQFSWGLTVQNGADDVGDDLFYALRGNVNISDHATDFREGAYGAGEELEATVGGAYFSDESIDDADGFAVDGSLTSGPFSAQAAILSFGDGVSSAGFDNEAGVLNSFGMAALGGMVDATPFSVMGTYMISDENIGSIAGAWEIGARFQDLDDTADSTIIDVGANYYVSGHDLKYIFNWTSVSSDVSALEFDLIQIGVNTRF